MLETYLTLLIFVIVAVGFGVVSLFAAYLLRPRVKDSIKTSTYECGMPALGTTEIKTNIRFYLYALLFVIFEVEALFVYPWAVSVKSINTPFVFAEMMIFLSVLFAGLVYAWKKGALSWE